MIIEIDEYKKRIAGYDPNHSEDAHAASARLADKDFIAALKTGVYDQVIFMAGGAASGKTEFCVSYLTGDDVLVYDGTLKNFDGFRIKLSNIKRYAKNSPVVKVILIIPDDWKQAFEIFLSREPKMKIETFFDTHIRSKIAVARVLLETNSDVEIFTSTPDQREIKLNYEKIPIEDRREVARKLLLVAREIESHAQLRGLEINVNYDIFDKYESK